MGFDLRSALIGIVVFVMALLFLGAVYAVLGLYDIGADAPHMGITRAAIGYVRERSIAVRAQFVTLPKGLEDPGRVADGASDYDEMCTICHLAPGMKENEMRPGLYPKPPRLAEIPAAPPAEQFWVIKHGIKLTGMPSWGKTHSDDDVWNLVAFLKKLPDLEPDQYRAMAGGADAPPKPAGGG